ncbi:MAG TPA: cation:proton antiporter [Candidatus Saccharimonadales bacterium]|jgi:cell volume regulation protein A|nr:cation:proton antiporter [Candidatus Saccharimonadales bacterium]
MNLTYLFGLLGGLLVLAFVANRMFRWTRIPDVVVLMATGVVIGPILGWARPDQFKDVTHAFGTLALILILFEGGLDLNIRETLSHFPGGLLFGAFAYALSTFSVGFVVSASFGISRADGLLAGAVVGCTSSTIVLPVLQQWKSGKAVKIILLLESTLGDILGVLTVGFLIGTHHAGHSAVGDFLAGFFSQVAISLGVSFLIGLSWSRLLPYLSEQQFWQVLTFSMVLLLYAGTESLGGSGLLAVLGFGLTLSNLSGGHSSVVPTLFQLSQGGGETHEQILNFHAELSFLVRTFFFVLIGVVVELSGLRPIWLLLLGVTGAIFLARWISIQLCRWSWSELGPADREKILWMLPRGLITIVLALEVVEVRGQSMSFLSPMAFAVILVTNLLLVFGSIRTKKMATSESEEPLDAIEVTKDAIPPEPRTL